MLEIYNIISLLSRGSDSGSPGSFSSNHKKEADIVVYEALIC